MPNKNPSTKELKCFSQWLGIPPEECPPNHYRLLGLPPFSDKLDQIRMAADDCILRIDQCVDPSNSEDVADGKMARNYVSQVAIGLLNQESKALYDSELRVALSGPHFQNAQPQNRNVSLPGNSGKTPKPEVSSPCVSHEPASPPPLNTNRLLHTPQTSPNLPEGGAKARTKSNPKPSPSAFASPPGLPSRASQAWMTKRVWIGLAVFANLIAIGGIFWLLLREPKEAPGLAIKPPVDIKPAPKPESTPQPKPEPILRPKSVPIRPPKPEPTSRPNSEPTTKAESTLLAEPEPLQKHLPLAPFEDLASEWALLDPQEPGFPPQRTVSAGKIAKPFQKNLRLELDQGVTDLENDYKFELRQLEGTEGLATDWGVYLKAAGSIGAEVPKSLSGRIARFFFDGQDRLRFQWTNSFPFKFAAQLANATLVLRLDSHIHMINLRVPSHADQIAFDFSETGGNPRSYETTAPMNALPQFETVSLLMPNIDKAFDQVEYLPIDQKVPLSLSKGKVDVGHIILGATRQIDLQFRCIRPQEAPNTISLEMRPFFFLHKNSKVPSRGKVPSYGRKLLTRRRIEKEIISYKSSIKKKFSDLQEHVALFRQFETALPIAHRMPMGDVHEVRLKEKAIQAAQQGMRKHRRSIQLILKQLPESYRVLADLYQVRSLARQLHNLGPLTLQIYAENGDTKVALAIADGKPPHIPPQIRIPTNASAAGSWIDANQGIIFDLGAGQAAVATQLKTQAVARGIWEEQPDRVMINVNGINNYVPFEEIMLKGSPGSDLFRIF